MSWLWASSTKHCKGTQALHLQQQDPSGPFAAELGGALLSVPNVLRRQAGCGPAELQLCMCCKNQRKDEQLATHDCLTVHRLAACHKTMLTAHTVEVSLDSTWHGTFLALTGCSAGCHATQQQAAFQRCEGSVGV